VIETGGGDGMMYGLLGYACANTEDHIAAESAYRMAALMEPERLDWRMGMANSFFKQRRYGEATALCATLIEQRPDDAKLWLLQANAFVGLKQVDKAAENLELVDRLGKSTFDSLSLLGDIYVNEGMHDLATNAWLRAIEQDQKQNHEPALRAANQLVARAAYDAGGKLVDGIERSYGSSLDARAKLDLLRLRARLALATGAGDQEAALLEEIVALDPLDGNSLILLGQFHARNGDVDRAIFRYEQAAEIEAFAADAKVRHAQLLAGQGEFEKAVPLLRAAQSLNRREHVQRFLEDVERVAAGR
jgi:tetratricopeptide (TPR) repeat protein